MTRAGLLPVLLLGLVLAGCAHDDPAVTSSPSRTPAASSARPTATPGPAKDFGYLTAVLSSTDPVRLSFDRAVLLTGKEADKAAAAHGDETPVPNDQYVINDNPKLRTVTLAAGVRVLGSIGLNSYAGDGSRVELTARTLEQLLGFLGTDRGRHTPFHLQYGAGGVVVSVEEQYQP